MGWFLGVLREGRGTYGVHAVDSKAEVSRIDLLGSGLTEGLQGWESAVFGEGERNDLKGLGKGSDGILLDSRNLKISEKKVQKNSKKVNKSQKHKEFLPASLSQS